MADIKYYVHTIVEAGMGPQWSLADDMHWKSEAMDLATAHWEYVNRLRENLLGLMRETGNAEEKIAEVTKAVDEISKIQFFDGSDVHLNPDLGTFSPVQFPDETIISLVVEDGYLVALTYEI